MSFIVLAIVSLIILTLNHIPKKWQIWLTFILLLGALGIFFDYFSLQYGFIAEKLPYLLKVGLLNTLWVSALSIVIACFIGFIAAITSSTFSPVTAEVKNKGEYHRNGRW